MKFKTLLVATFLLAFCATAGAKTTITWWQFWTDPNIKPVLQGMVSEFEQANPDIEVELTDLTWANGHEKIVIAFGAGTGPDVVELGSDWIAEFADKPDALMPQGNEMQRGGAGCADPIKDDRWQVCNHSFQTDDVVDAVCDAGDQRSILRISQGIVGRKEDERGNFFRMHMLVK